MNSSEKVEIQPLAENDLTTETSKNSQVIQNTCSADLLKSGEK